jgi:hypothetical protein
MQQIAATGAGTPMALPIEGTGVAGASVGGAGELAGAGAGESENVEANDTGIPDQPTGSLKTPNKKFWDQQGIDPHAVKKDVVGGSESKYDLHIDRDKYVWIKRKGEANSKAQPVGRLEDVAKYYPPED